MNIYKRFNLLKDIFLAKFRGRMPMYEIFMKNKKVLDIGCGEGKLLAKNPQLISGIDINDTLVDKLLTKGFDVKKSDVQNIDFPDNFFEVIHCNNVIEHLNPGEAYKMFQEMSRVLKPNGIILLMTPMPSIIWDTFGHVRPYTPRSISKLFRDVSLESFDSIKGLEIENVVYYSFWGPSKISWLVATILANIFPFFRSSYIMVIRKK